MAGDTSKIEYHGDDTPVVVRFYERDFYMLSNFSAFAVSIWGEVFPTSEHAYQWSKFYHPYTMAEFEFNTLRKPLRDMILHASSAHDAFKTAERYADWKRPDWLDVREDIMVEILHAKAAQHAYVRRKLLSTGNRTLIEDSWRDDFWGWGPNRDGKNTLGVLWMKVRQQLVEFDAEQAAQAQRWAKDQGLKV